LPAKAEIPSRLRRRPKDDRGYPIPFIAAFGPNGEPDFRIMSTSRVLECVNQRRCGLCGQPMSRIVYFIGGPESERTRSFLDPAMHHDCAVYALKTCPHLAMAKSHYSRAALPAGTRTAESASAEKMDRFGLFKTTGYHARQADGEIAIKAEPWLEVTWWKEGKPLAAAPAG